MKEKLVGKNYMRGFSTLEIVIALALMIVVIVGAVNANMAAQYWSLTSQTSTEALYKAKTLIEQLRATSGADFQQASSSVLAPSVDVNEPSDTSCIEGGLCYFTKSNVTDISSCSKYVEAYVEWRLALRYPTTTESLYTNLTNNSEIVALGGDCALNEPGGDWIHSTPQSVGQVSLAPLSTQGIDVLQKKIYTTASSAPQFRVFSVPTAVGQDPVLLGSTAGKGYRLNGLDAVRDAGTGRTYTFVTQHASTSQLAVMDVTDATNPTLVTERTLSGVLQTGSYPEGWRVVAYGGRAYVVTRETDGPELHIFNINAPTQPSEIVSAKTELNRTVNDMVVREQMIDGAMERFLFLAGSADLKELGMYKVTNDTPTEVVALDLSGGQDALSVFLTGNRLYVGRASGSGPELYVFDIRELLDGDTTPRGTSEVGADVHTIRGSGSILLLGTAKSGEEFQAWESDEDTWSASVVNAGRTSFQNIPRLAPLGIDLSGDWVYLQSQSATQPELLKSIYTP